MDRYKLSRRGLEILADDARMFRRDSQQGQSWTLWAPTSLLPISESVDADAHGLGELSLRQANEASERGNVLAGFEFALDEAFTQTRGDGGLEVSIGKFSDVIGGHVMSLR